MSLRDRIASWWWERRNPKTVAEVLRKIEAHRNGEGVLEE